MKSKLFLICLLLTLSTFAQQRQSISVNYKPSLTYFGKQNQTFKSASYTSGKGLQTFKSDINVLYSYRICHKLNIATGIEYAQQGQNLEFKIAGQPNLSEAIYKIQLDYLRIPVLINFSLLKCKTGELDVFSGISVGKVLKRKDNYQLIIPEAILLSGPETRYKTTDWSLPVGVGCKKLLTEKIFANAGFEYSIGLSNALTRNTAAKFGALAEFEHSRQNRLSLNIGLGVHL